MTGKSLKTLLTPFNIALAYTVLGGLWIFFADFLLTGIVDAPPQTGRARILNHWIFIVVSGQALYWLIRHRDKLFERSQETLFRVNRALRFFSECNKAITWEREESALLRKICRILVMLGGYRLAWVGYAQQDEEKTVRQMAHWGYEDGYLETLKVTWDESDTGRGPAGTTIRTGQTTVVQHIATNPKFKPWREDALKHGFAAAIALPLRSGKDVFGILVILAGEADAFNIEEINLLEELVDDLSAGIMAIRKDAEQAKIKEEQQLLAAVIEQESEGVMIFDRDGIIQYINPAWESICGIHSAQVIGRRIMSRECARNCPLHLAMQATIETANVVTDTFVCSRLADHPKELGSHIAPIRGSNNTIMRYVAMIRDVTHEMQLEDQLRTAQKMEAIATLSGGIAHDFNNILAAIITNTELTLDDVPENSNAHEQLKIVLQAGLRGKNLVKQIKAISQQSGNERRPVRVEKIVEECLQLLRASLPTIIEIRKHIAPEVGLVYADPTQLHQVMLNLCTNAAEAMKDGDGLLEVRLEPFHHNAHPLTGHTGLPPGDFICLTIRDNGQGMDRATMERIFDPFFTTKGHGKGTGLGLSVAHNIIKSHGGTITVASDLGRGTTFRVFLPRLEACELPAPAPGTLPLRGGNECILLVDDEEDLVLAGKKMLERLGYEVVTGTDGREAFELFIAQPKRFDLVITDQTMPCMTGEMLAREILNIRPDIPIILCSGRGETIDHQHYMQRARDIGIRELVGKPFEREEITQTIRRLLD